MSSIHTGIATEHKPVKMLFIHHSTGGNLIKEGNLRDEIRKLDSEIEFWDHNYNLSPFFAKLLSTYTHLKGLSNAQGMVTGRDYNIVLSNNSPKEYADIFSRDASDATLREILTYDIIAFKNCYPTTHITSDQQLEEDMHYYTIVRDSLKKYPNKQFVLLTPPPARRATTNSDNASRAISLVNWLKSDEFNQGIANMHVFDFFGLLFDKNGMLKEECQRLLPWDSHPNKKANKTIAPLFARYLAELTNC